MTSTTDTRPVRRAPLFPRAAPLPVSGYCPPPGQVDVWLVPVSPHQCTEAERSAHLLGPDATRRLDRGVHPRLRPRVLLAEVTLRLLLAACAGLPPQLVRPVRERCAACRGRHGRQVLPEVPGLHFSTDHTAETVVCALAAAPVGIAAEEREPWDAGLLDADTLAPQLHPAERLAIAVQPPRRRGAALLNCWTRKEAYLRGSHNGLEADRGTICVGPGPGYGTPLARVDSWSLLPVPAGAGVSAAVALRRAGELPPRVRTFGADLTAWRHAAPHRPAELSRLPSGSEKGN
ncbi:4-phosphopantetheinyl transferase [Streptomyces sp. NPDC052101]|uniref:4'-phosphopantetheinyl transferase family protein n=1 Tax=Streptomyces sp. NPDC052101 TaxID=3155763 RepID=UPI0034231CB4